VSRENIQIIRELAAAFNDRDLDAAFAVLHPEAELRAQLDALRAAGLV
jgi:hypothetical protein